MSLSTFSLSVSSPTGKVYAGSAWQLSAISPQGAFAVRAHHESFLANLSPGRIEVAETPEKRMAYQIRSGIFSFHDNVCTVAVELAAADDNLSDATERKV